MSNQTRLNDFARLIIADTGGVRFETRAGTGRGDHFGDAQSVLIEQDEMRQIVAEYLREHPTVLDDEDDIRVVVDA